MYPKWLYHKDVPEGKIFNNAIEEINAGLEWVESPADILFETVDVPNSIWAEESLQPEVVEIEIPSKDEEISTQAKPKPKKGK